MEVQLKSAREMFEELGFIVNDNIIKGALINNRKWQSVSVVKILDRNYINEDDYIEDETDSDFINRLGTFTALELFFENGLFGPSLTIMEKEIKVIPDGERIDVEYNGMGLIGERKQLSYIGAIFLPKEIQAINKMIEELGWNE